MVRAARSRILDTPPFGTALAAIVLGMLTPTPVARTALLALAVALIAWAPADAESGRRAGIVTALSGTATVTRASLGSPRALRFRDDVMLHDRIATGDQSIARILLGGKAVVTVRERSVVTITESPRISRVDVETGKVALAVAKERMRPGDSIELRTPNAVAGIRGTVVIAEVSRQGSAPSTRFTLLTGLIEVALLDAARRPVGPAAFLTPLQTIVVDRRLSPVRPITRSEGASASAEFGLPMKIQPRGGAQWIANDQVTQAVAIIEPDRARVIGDRDRNRGGGGDADRGRGKDGDAGPDVKPDKGGKASRDDTSDKVKGPPIPIPTTPIVPAAALQPSGDGKSKGKGGRD